MSCPHPSGEGRVGILAGDAGDRAHIPQQRGGANSGVVRGLSHIGGGWWWMNPRSTAGRS